MSYPNMKAGKIARLDSSSNSLESLTIQLPANEESPFEKMAGTIQIDQEIQLEDNRTAYIGQAAVEDVENASKFTINDSGKVEETTRLQKIVKTTHYILIPDSFLAISNSGGEFLISLLNSHTDHTAFFSNIDIDSFVENNQDSIPWKIGFDSYSDNAENGVIHGTELYEDQEFGNILNSVNKNQIGLNQEVEEDSLKVFATKSGYIEIYQPSTYDSKDFLEYIESEVLPFLKME